MSLLNAGLVAAADTALGPFRTLPPLVGLGIISLLTAVVMLVIFKRTSDQARLDAVKRKIHASLFEIRLFNDDFSAILRAQADILRHNATYLRLSLLPMIWVIVPLVLVIAQLQFHYGYAALQPGDEVLLKARVRSGAGDAVSLEAPPEVKVDTPAVWLPGASEVIWRMRPTAPGRFDVRVKTGAETYTKTLQVAGGVVRRSPVRVESGLMNQLLYPSEPPLPRDGSISEIAVAYEEQDLPVLGMNLNWMVVYFVLSLVFAFALKKPFGVTI